MQGLFRKSPGVSGGSIVDEAGCQSGLLHSVLCDTQSFTLLPTGTQKGGGRGRKREARHSEIGLHLFAWSRRGTITADACGLRRRLCSSVVPVYPLGRRRIRQAHTCTPTDTRRPLLLHPLRAATAALARSLAPSLINVLTPCDCACLCC